MKKILFGVTITFTLLLSGCGESVEEKKIREKIEFKEAEKKAFEKLNELHKSGNKDKKAQEEALKELNELDKKKREKQKELRKNGQGDFSNAK